MDEKQEYVLDSSTWGMLEDVHQAALHGDYDDVVTSAERLVNNLLLLGSRFFIADHGNYGFMQALREFRDYDLDSEKLRKVMTKSIPSFIASDRGMLVLHSVTSNKRAHGVIVGVVNSEMSYEQQNMVTVAAKCIAYALDGLSHREAWKQELIAIEAMMFARGSDVVRPSLYDAITNLPNRDLFRDRLLVSMSRARRTGVSSAVMYVSINNSLDHGYAFTIHTAKSVSERLKKALRSEDTVASFGSNLYAIALNGLRNPDDSMTAVIDKISGSLSAPLHHNGKDIVPTFAMGYVLYPDDAANVEDLLLFADSALHQARDSNKTCVHYEPHFAARTSRRATLERDLKNAIRDNQLKLAFQPQVRAVNGNIHGFEALVRWVHPQYGFVSPVEFISMAEDIGMIMPIGEWVLREACARHADMRAKGMPKAMVAVNLSAQQFLATGLVDLVESVMIEHKLLAGDLEIEVTESIGMHGAELCVDILEKFEKLGVTISIDDFGTGYSNLAYMKHFPLHAVKIDRAFVQDLPDSQDDASIVRSITSMSHELGLHVVAEGVETQQQLDFLRHVGVDVIQGYFTGKPMFAEECDAWIRAKTEN